MKPHRGLGGKVGRVFRRKAPAQVLESGHLAVSSSSPGEPIRDACGTHSAGRPVRPSLGQLLRETRESKNITLEQAESVTRIRARYLQALENGEYDQLPTPGHVYGFLHNYAIYLGLDWGEVEAQYAQERPAHRHLMPEIFHPKDISLAPRRSWFKVDLVLGSIIVLVILVVSAWGFWQYGRPLLSSFWMPVATATATAETRATAVNPTSTMTATPGMPVDKLTAMSTRPLPTATSVANTPTVTLSAPLPITTPTPEATATPTLTPTTNLPVPTPERAGSVVFSIKVVERAWLQVTVDGLETPGQLLEAGEEREWEARNTIYFICGNAGGVEVTVNGNELGTLGERGQVVEKWWTPQGEITPTPQAAEPTATATVSPEGAASPTVAPVDKLTATPKP
jgi:cytoskeletal protein RodZ